MSEDPGGASRGKGEGGDDDGVAGASWPVELAGVTESLVSTRGPNGRYNVAALGLFAGDPVTARTWGNTRTRRNVAREGEGYVQFTTDPVDFADCALSIVEREAGPILESADAWVRVSVDRIDDGESGDTHWVEWALTPVESRVLERRVPTLDRGRAAVIEATVAASRLGVPAYDERVLRERLEWCGSVVERAGSDREREAFERVRTHAGLDDENR